MNLAIQLNDWWLAQLANKPTPKAAAKQKLSQKGWSYRRAAMQLGTSYQHISEVLNGHRDSRALLARIEELPVRKGVRP